MRYLKESARKRADDNESIVAFAADDLMNFIHRNHIKDFTGGLYDETDAAWWREVRSIILSDDNLKDLNYEKGGLGYTGVIKFYVDFLASKYNPLNAPESFDDTGYGTSVADGGMDVDNGPMSEGKVLEMHLTRHERNPRLRALCIRHYGAVCQVCGFDFEKVYGAIGHNFIEVHHKWPLSAIEDEHEVDPIRDLVPLCSNCHSMIHRGTGPANVIPWDEFVANYKGPKFKDNENRQKNDRYEESRR